MAERRLAFQAQAEAAAAVALAPLPPAARFSLRCRPAGADRLGTAFGPALPRQACRAAVAGDRAALWLGPDEWLLLAPEADLAAIPGEIAAALGDAPYSLVDVSHRNAGLEVSGPHSSLALNAGCPLDLDLSAFPVGMCTRTLLGKAEIVLWRTEEHRYHVELWRSFGAYVWAFLEEARRGLDDQPV